MLCPLRLSVCLLCCPACLGAGVCACCALPAPHLGLRLVRLRAACPHFGAGLARFGVCDVLLCVSRPAFRLISPRYVLCAYAHICIPTRFVLILFSVSLCGFCLIARACSDDRPKRARLRESLPLRCPCLARIFRTVGGICLEMLDISPARSDNRSRNRIRGPLGPVR